jgi:16S rRNA (adenine1518-N6/adenine1519-N6)-dimethyltransferase
MKQVLEERRLLLTKALGQNFLHDQNQVKRIVAAAHLDPTERVLEIGPGLGPLTERLLEAAGEVLAIEKDARLVEILRSRLPCKPAAGSRLELVHDDALDFLRRTPRDWSGWKLVANLPYSVASPLLVELAQAGKAPLAMVATLQLEVARRLMASPGGADFGVLTLLVQLQYRPVEWFKIPAACFFPEPDVDSACVCLARRDPPLLPPALGPEFARIVKRGFSQRRKMMLKLLKQDWTAEALEGAWAELGLSPQARAETVTLEQFVRLTGQLSPESKHG